MKVYCRAQHEDDLPGDDRWLSPSEIRVLEGLRLSKRAADWRLGRWTVKSALMQMPDLPSRSAADWQILAGHDGAPRIHLDGRILDIPISLSHSGPRAFCVLSDSDIRLGCDLEMVEPRSRPFEETYFCESELNWLDQCDQAERDRYVTLIWSAKESVLKALHVGLMADTRRVVVRQPVSSNKKGWMCIEASDREESELYRGWWRIAGNSIYTLLSDRAISRPINLPVKPVGQLNSMQCRQMNTW